MIVTESDTDSKTSPTSEVNSRSVARSNSSLLTPPPAYQTAPTNPRLTPTMPPTQPLIAPRSRPRAWKRFLAAFSVAALIYILLAFLLKSCIDIGRRHVVEGVPAEPSEEDGRIIGCTNDTWSFQTIQNPSSISDIPPYSSKASFSLPVSSSLIFLLSRGSNGQGSIKFELADHSGDNVDVNVVVSYHTLEARRRSRVCHLERDEGGQGVGIFTPRRVFSSLPTSERVTFDITVRFPKSGTTNNPLVINALETDMSSWSHQIADLQGRVIFKSLSLKASNSPIRSEPVSTNFTTIKTSNQPITGSFTVTDSLSLTTSNAAITATVRLENRDSHNPTWVEMKTSNGRIETPITLVSSDQSPSPSPAAFRVTARTSNKPLKITFPEAPTSPFSHLTLSGKTSNGATSVKLHPTYEGSISLKTSNATPKLLHAGGPKDPSGRGRNRNVEVRKVIKGALEAGAWWGNDSNKDEGKGTVSITTSNAENVVDLT